MTAYFSLIQYCPEPARRESANVGLVLVCPGMDYLNPRTTTNHDRIRGFFDVRGQELANLREAEEALVARIKRARHSLMSPEGLASFASLQVNRLSMTAPTSIKVENVEHAFERLFSEYVHERRVKAPSSSNLRPRLSKLFRPFIAQKRAQESVEISVPVLEKPWEVDYKYVNGIVNFVRVQSIGSLRAETEAVKSIMDWDLLKKHDAVEADAALLVPMATPVDTEQEKRRQKLSQLFEEYEAQPIFEEDFAKFEEKVQKDLASVS